MKLDARFVAAASEAGHWPRWDLPELAVAGRSNVGKSSFINALTGIRDLARTSATPGRTRSINFFVIAQGAHPRRELALVDLPGFGYAKMSKSEAARVGAVMRDYLESRQNLAGLALLIDSRRQPQTEERELVAALNRRDKPVIVIATKCDKLRRSERRPALSALAAVGVAPIMVSALSGEGIEQVRKTVLDFASAR